MGDTDAERLARKEARAGVKHPDPINYDATEMTTPSGKRIKVTDQEFAIMLEKAGGLKTRVAKQLGVTLPAVCHRIKRSRYLSEVCKTVEEQVLDLAEAGLIKAARDGEPWAITFILKCKGRKRGWIERQDIAFGGDAEALPPPIVLSVHDAGFIEAERERQKREFAEVVDAAYTEMMPQGTSAESDEKIETSGPTAQPSVGAEGDVADIAPTDGLSGAESRETGAEAAQDAPGGAEASAQGDRENAPTGAEIAPVADGGGKRLQNVTDSPQPPQPRAPRTPSEAAAMRREREARDRAANGVGQGKQRAAQPYRAVPVTFPRRQ
jgi:hypothetical protein